MSPLKLELLKIMAKRRGPETALIATVTHDGKGIATIDGKKVFIAGALAGEEVRFQRRKVRRNYDEAELLEVLLPSADRIEPRCDAYGVCGGCSLQRPVPGTAPVLRFPSLSNGQKTLAG